MLARSHKAGNFFVPFWAVRAQSLVFWDRFEVFSGNPLDRLRDGDMVVELVVRDGWTAINLVFDNRLDLTRGLENDALTLLKLHTRMLSLTCGGLGYTGVSPQQRVTETVQKGLAMDSLTATSVSSGDNHQRSDV